MLQWGGLGPLSDPNYLGVSFRAGQRTVGFSLHSWPDLQVGWKLLESTSWEVFSSTALSIMRPLHNNKKEVINSREREGKRSWRMGRGRYRTITWYSYLKVSKIFFF